LNRHTRPALGIAGALLAAALVVAACGRGNSGAGGADPLAPTIPAEASQTLDLQVAEVPSPETTDALSPAPTFDPGTAIDAVDSDLAELDQFLSGLDTSLTESDGGAYGGE
jgi:hypothetical protein